MKKKGISNGKSPHNCVTVPLFFTPRAQAAQARMQLASPVKNINTTKITKYGMVSDPRDCAVYDEDLPLAFCGSDKV